MRKDFRKFVSSILCAAMLFSTLVFSPLSVSAAYPADLGMVIGLDERWVQADASSPVYFTSIAGINIGYKPEWSGDRTLTASDITNLTVYTNGVASPLKIASVERWDMQYVGYDYYNVSFSQPLTTYPATYRFSLTVKGISFNDGEIPSDIVDNDRQYRQVMADGASIVPVSAPTVQKRDGVTKTVTVTFGATKYRLDNTPMPEQSLLYNNTAYFPAAYLFRAMGYQTSWDAATNVTTAVSTGNAPAVPATSDKPLFPNGTTKQITAVFGATQYVVDGKLLTEDSLLYNDVAYFPAAYLVEMLGCRAVWDSTTNTTTVITPCT